jgi:hypothetical protein
LLSLLQDPAATTALGLRGQATALESGDIDANGRRFATQLRAANREPPPGLLRFRALLILYLLLKRWLPSVC